MRRRTRIRRAHRCRRRDLERRSEDHLSPAARTAHLDTGFVRRVDHLRARGLAAKLHLALDRAPQFAGLSADRPRRSSAARSVAAVSRTGVQPREVRRVFIRTRHGDHRAHHQRSAARAGRQTRDLGHRAICTLRAQGRLGHAARAIHGAVHRDSGDPCTGVAQQHRERRTADPARHGAGVSHQRRPLASRRSRFRPVFHGAPGAGRRTIPHSAAGSVSLRRRLPSGRRRHGHRRSQRGTSRFCGQPE